MSFDPMQYYTLLEATPEVTEAELKIKYRDKAKFWHPDHNTSPNALEVFQKLSVAYDILKDKKKRAIYDLLATAYDKADFPDMDNLKVYKSAAGEETPFLRVFKLYKIKGMQGTEEKLIGTFADASNFIRTITAANWLKGWFNPAQWKKTAQGLIQNYKNINRNTADNYKLLIHNAAAYLNENKLENAALSVAQAFGYATQPQKDALQNISAQMRFEKAPFKDFNYAYLQKIQLHIPYALASLVVVLGLLAGVGFYKGNFQKVSEVVSSYYQKVRFNTGGETVDDLVVGKIFNIPVDVYDTNMLYHLTSAQKVMYGPSEKFDVLAEAVRGQTVRITGYTPDEVWYRVMLDNGEMGFIKKEHLKKGVEKEIPTDSKIFRNKNG